jgi:hypothetical protein
MKIKTNLRAGSGGADNSTTSVDTSGQKQNQNGKPGTTTTVVYYYPPVSRCVGL